MAVHRGGARQSDAFGQPLAACPAALRDVDRAETDALAASALVLAADHLVVAMARFLMELTAKQPRVALHSAHWAVLDAILWVRRAVSAGVPQVRRAARAWQQCLVGLVLLPLSLDSQGELEWQLARAWAGHSPGRHLVLTEAQRQSKAVLLPDAGKRSYLPPATVSRWGQRV